MPAERPTRPRAVPQGLAWEIVELHYACRNAFQRIYDSYEERVARQVAEQGVAREKLKLGPQETKDLFDTWALQVLIRERVHRLREVSHSYFRDNDVDDPYDSKVSRIYHELSILKEEHMSVRNFPAGGGHREFARLFREVSEYYPQRLRRVRDLLQRAQKRFDLIVPQFADDPIVLRSAYLFREELWPQESGRSLQRFLQKVFVGEGPLHGFVMVARSFLKTGFYEHAAAAARLGVAVGGKSAQARSTRAQQVRDEIAELDRIAARAEAQRAALEEAVR